MKTIHNESYQKCITLLKSKRVEKGITQAQLAERMRVSQAVISKIETCERRLDVIELRDICRIIDISFTEFINEISQF